MPNMNISINYRRPFGAVQLYQGKSALRSVINALVGIDASHTEADAVKVSYNDTVAPNSNLAYAGQAAALLVGSTLTGAVGGTIGGTAVTVTAAGGDTATQTLLVAAIKANTTVNTFVTATSKLAQLTVASVVAGTTVTIWGQVFTALANGVTPTQFGQFSVGASDTACALALTNAINQHPSLAGRIRAVSLVGAVFVGTVDDRVPAAFERITNPSATTITVNTGVPVAGTRCMVLAAVPGTIGNFVDIVASGTGMTLATNGAASKLGSGMGGGTPAFTIDVVP
jgi:hypothetical protein